VSARHESARHGSAPHENENGNENMVHDEHPGLARERTMLAWTRTALSFGAVGGAIVKSHVIIGLVVLAIAPVAWYLGRISSRNEVGAEGVAEQLGGRLWLITAVVLVVSVVALIVSLGSQL
jgi:uncharacterized membrane protein YidH (DUF202 family)